MNFQLEIKNTLESSLKEYGFEVMSSESHYMVFGNGLCQVLIQSDLNNVIFMVRSAESETWVPPGSVLMIREGKGIDEVFPSLDINLNKTPRHTKEIDLIRSSLHQLSIDIKSGKYRSFFKGEFSEVDVFLKWLEIKNKELNRN